ncbi:MAG: LacI family DNA-binding transcriptional regulator [Capsulimonadaceae bacterium]|nr:LacI family DNA-binding transcriptional regulator [Capsulimonadaceae bacterium]
MAATLQYIAQKVGVSHMTVSRVLNNSTDCRVSPETRERVLKAAHEAGYRPNVFARHLLGKRNMTLGLILGGTHNPFYMSVAREVEQAAAGAGYRIFTILQPWVSPNLADADMLPVDGLLVWSPVPQNLPSMLRAGKVKTPVVYLGYQVDDGSEYVRFDLAGGLRLAVRHLVARGYKRIAYAIPDSDRVREFPDVRWIAYFDLCREIGMTPEPLDFDGNGNRHTAGFQLGQRLAATDRSSRPDAVIVTGDMAAMGLYHGAIRGGLSVPADLAIAGFDGIEEVQFLDKALTTVLCPVDQFGKAAVEVMVERLSAAENAPPRQVEIATTLVEGDTT